MKANSSISLRQVCVAWLALAACLFTPAPWALQAQSAALIQVSEILYAPRDSGEWLEIVNIGSRSVDLDDLSIMVTSGESVGVFDVSPYESTQATLVPGASVVIAVDPLAFSGAYPTYDGPLFRSPLMLPDAGLPTVSLLIRGSGVHEITYAPDRRANGTGVSLHTSGDGLVVAPATPGEIARNPLESYQAQPPGISLVTSVTGGSDADDSVFLGEGDTITLRVFHTEYLVPLTADVLVGDAVRRPFLASPESDDVQQVFTYAVREDDADGGLSYTVASDSGLVGEGGIMHDGLPAIVDLTQPVITLLRTENGIDVTVEEEHPAEHVRYKVSDDGSCDAASYQTITSPEWRVPLPRGGESARIDLSETEQDHPVCVAVSDIAGNTAYAVSEPSQARDSTPVAGPMVARFSEISYSTSENITTEWLEVVNAGADDLDLSALTLVDGDVSRSITHASGPALVPPQSVAVIAKNPDAFSSDFSNYDGPLFRSPMSLLDSGDILSLQVTESGDVLDTVSYSSDDGAKKDGMTLHVFDGSVSAGQPTPGVAAAAVTEQPDLLDRSATFTGTGPVAVVSHINRRPVPTGQNLFFTSGDSVLAGFVIADETTRYAGDTVVSRHGLSLTPSARNTSFRISDPAIRDRPDGSIRADYTVHFARRSDGSVRDNRVALSLSVRNDGGEENDRRDDIVLVRNTVAPTIMNGTTESNLIFSGDNAKRVIVPIRVAGVQMGDWLRVTYGGSCGEGLLPFIVRNGGYGVRYELENGTYDDCTISVTDTAGNASAVVTLPQITVRR